MAVAPDNSALQVFYGTVPLVATAVWAIWSNNSRLNELSKRLDDLKNSLNQRIDGLADQVHQQGVKLDGLSEKVSSIDTRLARIETRLDLPKLVTGY
jgi:uncharacterized protein YlxW (UPF0749 family)